MTRPILAIILVVGLSACLATGPDGPPPGAALQADFAMPVPEGYCRLSRNHPVDAEMFELMEELNAGHNAVVGIAGDCAELEAWRTSDEGYVSQLVTYLTPLSSRHQRVSMSRAQFIRQMDFELSKADPMAEAGREIERRLRESEHAVQLESMVNLGVLGTDDDAVYIGVIEQVANANGETGHVVSVGGLTLANGKIANLVMTAPYEGSDSVRRLLQAQARNVRAFLAANPDVDG